MVGRGLLLLVVVTCGLGLWILRQGNAKQADPDAPARGIELIHGTDPAVVLPSEPDSKPVIVAEPAAQASALELRRARERVQRAEQALDAMDLELERFELFVADVEARGENPADYASDVMVDFQPLLNRFLDAQAKLDAAVAEQRRVEAVALGSAASTSEQPAAD